uniref:Uncharacterized protein n=1 Tax=Nannochloropsis gaditana (strain CCMP526) TaxID=1093141 RepID=I2CQN2_NANGC
MLGTRYVELFHTTPEELARALNGQQHIAGSSAVCFGSSSAKTSESADSEISTSGRGEALTTLEA